jgi:hypothetical protein
LTDNAWPKSLEVTAAEITAVTVELRPMPKLSPGSNSQPGQFRLIRGELSPAVHASTTSNGDLNRSIEGGVAQASVMWLLHRGLEVVQDRGEALEQQIIQFSSAVFDAIGTSYPELRNSGRERLWLIYFKGLLTANTHPREEMVPALRNIASRYGFGGLPPLSKEPGETAKPNPEPASELEILEQIARSLAQNNSSFEP